MGSIRLLLVDDHLMIRDLFRRRLMEEPDLEVVGEAGTAEEAVRLAQEQRPDVILLDVQLPDVEGPVVAPHLKEISPGSRVLACSQYTDPATVLTMLHCGATGYIAKTAAVDELLEAIRTVARGRRFLCSEVLSVAEVGAANAPARRPDRASAPQLTAREMQVLKLITIGLRTRDIAAELGTSERTIETYRRRLGRKLGTSSVAGLTKYALRQQITEIDSEDPQAP